MNIFTNLKKWQQQRKSLTGSIGFVPTMGCLHAGHASLFEKARAENDIVVASIFVNPTQFNQVSDYEAYQRTLEKDCQLLESLGVDYLISPEEKDIYPDNYEVQVLETKLSTELEGEFRPGHFTGMLTIVLKLLNLVQSTRAYFGEKDYQQLMLIKKMVSALFLPVEIIGCEIIREETGLALSSRNSRLSDEEKKKAMLLSQLLKSDLSNENVMKKLKEAGFKTEYIVTEWGRRLGATWLGSVRLIDNVPFIEEGNKNVTMS